MFKVTLITAAIQVFQGPSAAEQTTLLELIDAHAQLSSWLWCAFRIALVMHVTSLSQRLSNDIDLSAPKGRQEPFDQGLCRTNGDVLSKNSKCLAGIAWSRALRSVLQGDMSNCICLPP